MRLVRNNQVESFFTAVLSHTISFKADLGEIVKEQERRDDIVNISRLMMETFDFVEQSYYDNLKKGNLDKCRGVKHSKDGNELLNSLKLIVGGIQGEEESDLQNIKYDDLNLITARIRNQLKIDLEPQHRLETEDFHCSSF